MHKHSDDAVVLKVDQLTVNYDKTPVLWDIHFSIPGGALVGVIGPNGAGKSTLLKALLGMITPLSGSIEFFGQPIRKVRRRVAYVPQRNSVDWDFPLTAKEVVLMGRYQHVGLFRWLRPIDRQIAVEALDKVGMAAFADRQIGQLSGGAAAKNFYRTRSCARGRSLFDG